MLRVFFFVLLVLVAKLGFGANERIPTLKKELELTRSDTAILRIYADLAYQYCAVKGDSALWYGTQTLSMLDSLTAQKVIKPDQQAVLLMKSEALIGKAYGYFARQAMDSSSQSFDQAIHVLKDELGKPSRSNAEKYHHLLAESLQNRGYTIFLQGDLKAPVADLEEAIRICREMPDSVMLGLAYKKLGNVLHRAGQLGEASQNYHLALDIFKSMGRNLDVAICNSAIARTKQDLKSYDEALAAYQDALAEFTKLNDKRGQAVCSSNIGGIYLSTSKYQECIDYKLRAADLYHQIKDKIGEGSQYSAIGIAYNSLKDFPKSEEYHEKALDLRMQVNNKVGIANSYGNLAALGLKQARLASGAKQTAFTNQADKYVRMAMEMISESADPQQKISLYSVRKGVEELKGNYKEALRWADEAKTLRDSLYNVERAQAVEEIEAKYQNKEQEHQLELKEKDLTEKELKLKQVRQVGILLFVLSVAIILILIVMYDSHRQNRKKNRELQEKNAIIEKQHREIQQQMETEKEISRNVKELSEFKQQMIGMLVHDLKNPLGGILSYEYIDDEDLRRDIVMHSSNEMLKLVENMLDVYKSESRAIQVNPDDVNLKELVAGEEKALIFLLKEKNIQLMVEAGETTNFTADPELIGRVLGNLLSNAIKFSPVEGRIRVRAEWEDGAVRIGISNQGPSIPADKQQLIFDPFGQHELQNLGITTSTGLGLTFCQMAVEAHGGTIGVNSAEGQETEFWFTLPQPKA